MRNWRTIAYRIALWYFVALFVALLAFFSGAVVLPFLGNFIYVAAGVLLLASPIALLLLLLGKSHFNYEADSPENHANRRVQKWAKVAAVVAGFLILSPFAVGFWAASQLPPGADASGIGGIWILFVPIVAPAMLVFLLASIALITVEFFPGRLRWLRNAAIVFAILWASSFLFEVANYTGVFDTWILGEKEEKEETIVDENSGIAVYVNEELGISFGYPRNWGRLETKVSPQNTGHVLLIVSKQYEEDVIIAGTHTVGYEPDARWPYWFEGLENYLENYSDRACRVDDDCVAHVNQNGVAYHAVTKALFDGTPEMYWNVDIQNDEYARLSFTTEDLAQKYPVEYMSLPEATEGIELILDTLKIQ